MFDLRLSILKDYQYSFRYKDIHFICKSPFINQSISVRLSAFEGCRTWQETYIEYHRLRQLVKQRYDEKILTKQKLQYVRGDCGDSDVKRYGGCVKQSQDFSIQMCDYNVVSLMNGFGRFATLLSHVWHNVYQVHNKNRISTQTDYDSIEKVTTDGAGI